MTEEIKEILGSLNKIAKAELFPEDLLTYKECDILLNYITNLQKENEDYKQRNEKAIEWCECVVNAKYTAGKLPNGKTTDMGYCLDLAEPLLNILQGGDE